MKNFILLLCSFCAFFWNVENFFDYREGRQSKGRFYSKCEGIAKVLMLYASQQDSFFPDIAAFAELENGFVLRQIVASTLLRKSGYRCIHYDSHDHRGIDCGLLYRSSRLTLIDSKPCHIYDSLGRIMPTRDILLASFLLQDGRRVDVLVNHHPSKYGGKSGYGRMAALSRMVQIRDSLRQYGGIFVSLGDFNDTPPCRINGLKDLSESLAAKGEGTIRFNGKWEMIDRCYVTDTLNARMQVFAPDILTVKDNAHGGIKPRRTNSGPRYLGGISDHFPITVRF